MRKETVHNEQSVDRGRVTQGKIVEAARSEFAEYGLSGARVDRIAAKAGINKAMIYYHFDSKENLYHETVTDFYRKVSDSIGQEITEVDSIEELLGVMAENYARLVMEMPEIRPILLRELAKPQGNLIDKIAAQIVGSGLPDKARELIDRGQIRGEIRLVDGTQAFVSFVTMNLGYYLLAPIIDKITGIDRRDSFINERKEAVVDLFLHGIKARE